ncbi:hypothetical protein BX661DRAFT_14085 [Kickxella alabastrina]|uniref:uncharacterized protein n=1 Tax=Kickxella alabastrina TaxID=61397 RepID=UPI00221ED24B|nr:uncharacterized protein BX661DRAFT_14085 [Kickxella alabastrina]KAI7828420.1 hypothetical protein BX661DRAFT_14085 [Kickxella alabastrina]
MAGWRRRALPTLSCRSATTPGAALATAASPRRARRDSWATWSSGWCRPGCTSRCARRWWPSAGTGARRCARRRATCWCLSRARARGWCASGSGRGCRTGWAACWRCGASRVAAAARPTRSRSTRRRWTTRAAAVGDRCHGRLDPGGRAPAAGAPADCGRKRRRRRGGGGGRRRRRRGGGGGGAARRRLQPAVGARVGAQVAGEHARPAAHPRALWRGGGHVLCVPAELLPVAGAAGGGRRRVVGLRPQLRVAVRRAAGGVGRGVHRDVGPPRVGHCHVLGRARRAARGRRAPCGLPPRRLCAGRCHWRAGARVVGRAALGAARRVGRRRGGAGGPVGGAGGGDICRADVCQRVLRRAAGQRSGAGAGGAADGAAAAVHGRVHARGVRAD